ncbi:glycosyltransferase [Allochromatium palmeri]|uniref:Glycosyltransferase n=1 Tax=Allochromatium palmeri TaxID=231048 RepID=A0A6N8EIM5_9GAMM|nr:glycosyltransferase [Allochromatium palmeri]MTW22759.1 glycosyltransferase [Allochromatium palmeri]
MEFPQIIPDAFVEVWPGEGPPEISVLMPIFHQTRYVRDAVLSILAQRGAVTEIIISDDGSTDDTFETAWRTVQDWLNARGSQHRILMRRGSERLWRDHQALLVDRASCDLVCYAHGDDVSHPGRARILVRVFNHRPEVTLLASEASSIDARGRNIGEERPVSRDIYLRHLSFEDILQYRSPFLIGFSQAWRRSSVASFPRLDRDFAAVSHDRILPFRAALTGKVALIRSQLIKRRLHPEAAHYLMFDEPDTSPKFGLSLNGLVARTAMKQDLALARSLEMVEERQYQDLLAEIDRLMGEAIETLLMTHRFQTRANRQIAWVDDETLRQLRWKRLREQAGQSQSLHVFIVSWTGRHDNSRSIAQTIKPHVDQITVVFSDRDDSMVPGFPCEAIRTPDAWYWGKKFRTCLTRMFHKPVTSPRNRRL